MCPEPTAEPAPEEGMDGASFDAQPVEEPACDPDSQTAEQADATAEPDFDPEPVEGEESADLAA